MGKAGAAFLPQVYRNTRTATRKRRAAPQLPSKMVTQVMSYVPEECPFITNNAERCGSTFRYRNQLNQQMMNCSHYCLENTTVWLSSLLQDLAQKQYISFEIPSLNRAYLSEYILHPIQFISSIGNGIYEYIPLNLDTPTNEIDKYTANLDQPIDELEVEIPIQLSEYRYQENGDEKYDEKSLYSLIQDESIRVQITDFFLTNSIFRHFVWDGRFEFNGGPFVLRGRYSPTHSHLSHLTPAFTPASQLF
jgi:hypothetical protein